jgi:predicted site-specific integrase-resolvase
MTTRDKILRLGEAADELHISRRQLDRLIQRGEIRAFEMFGIRYVYAVDIREIVNNAMRRPRAV